MKTNDQILLGCVKDFNSVIYYDVCLLIFHNFMSITTLSIDYTRIKTNMGATTWSRSQGISSRIFHTRRDLIPT